MPPTEGDPPMRSRHPMFYFRDGSVVLTVTNTEGSGTVLYRLHLSVLENRSTVFRDIFSLPFGNPLANTGDGTIVQLGRLEEATQGQNSAVLEGQDDEHPFELPAANVTQPKFDHLVTYLYSGSSAYPEDDQFLLDVLDLSSFFDIADGVRYAVESLQTRVTFNAVRRFKLARMYNIHQWIEPAIRDLLIWDFASIKLQDAYDIGLDALYHITQAKAKLQRLRIGMAFKPPQLAKGPACQTYSACASAWDREWWGELGRYILHPRVRASGTTIKSYTLATDIVGVCRGCRDATVEAMDLKGAFNKDNEILEEVVNEVKKAHGDFTPPRLDHCMTLMGCDPF